MMTPEYIEAHRLFHNFVFLFMYPENKATEASIDIHLVAFKEWCNDHDIPVDAVIQKYLIRFYDVDVGKFYKGNVWVWKIQGYDDRVKEIARVN